MVIGEVGLNTLQNTEGEQAAFLARVFEAAKVAGVRSVAPWTLNDFSHRRDPRLRTCPSSRRSTTTVCTAPTAPPSRPRPWSRPSGPAPHCPPTCSTTASRRPPGRPRGAPYLPELGVAVKTHLGDRARRQVVDQLHQHRQDRRGLAVVPGRPDHARAGRPEVARRGLGQGNAATGTTQIALSWFDINDKWLGGASSASLPAGTTGWTKLIGRRHRPGRLGQHADSPQVGRQHRHGLVRRRAGQQLLIDRHADPGEQAGVRPDGLLPRGRVGVPPPDQPRRPLERPTPGRPARRPGTNTVPE